MKDKAKIIVNKFADLMLPKKERLNELEHMIREGINKGDKEMKEEKRFFKVYCLIEAENEEKASETAMALWYEQEWITEETTNQ